MCTPASTLPLSPTSIRASCASTATAARASQRAGTSKALEHQVHSLPEQREIRAAAFDHKQAIEHADKVAREANVKLVRLRRLDAEASAAYEAAVHVVPPPATIADALADALRGVELS